MLCVATHTQQHLHTSGKLLPAEPVVVVGEVGEHQGDVRLGKLAALCRGVCSSEGNSKPLAGGHRPGLIAKAVCVSACLLVWDRK